MHPGYRKLKKLRSQNRLTRVANPYQSMTNKQNTNLKRFQTNEQAKSELMKGTNQGGKMPV